MEWHLYLDDTRSPHLFPMSDPALSRKPEENTVPVFWALNVEQALMYLRCYGAPTVMYLDYNLTCNDTAMKVLEAAKEAFPHDPPRYVYYLTGDWEGRDLMKSFIKEWKNECC